MGINDSPIRSILILLSAIVVVIAASIVNGQTTSQAKTQEEVAAATNAEPNNGSSVPAFTDYRGIKIGMSADEVRTKLDQVKKGESQDYWTYSERESAQIYYDSAGKVTAISIDYFGENSNAPTPDAVLGAAIEAKPDGSMYQLNRYREAGYWVSYNRTAGDKPIVTITMQKM
jgi:hypothetical protein